MATQQKGKNISESEQVGCQTPSVGHSVAWCSQCAAQALVINIEQAARLANVSLQHLVSYAATGSFHWVESSDGSRLVCLVSLWDWLRRATAPTLSLSLRKPARVTS
jgi:hypothetical protein